MSSLVRHGANVLADRAVSYVASRAYNAWKNRGKPSLKRNAAARGSYSGKFKKPKNWKTSKFSQNGVTVTQEYGNFREDTATVYIGHGFNWKYALITMCSAIIKKLANLAGVYPASLSEKWQGQLITVHGAGDWAFRYIYKLSETATAGSHSITFPTDGTWQDVVDSFASHLLTVTNVEHEFMNFQIVNTTSCVAAIDASDLFMTMYYKSTLNLQNQTKGFTATDDLANDVTNNPVQGMRYWGTGSGFHPRLRDNTLALLGDNTMVVNKDYSVMYFDPNGTNVTAEMQSYLRRPPSKGGLAGCTRTARIILNPGNIKKGILSKRLNLSINHFWRKILPAITGTATFLKVWLGNCEMFAFEKMCRTGAGDQVIRIGYEVNQIYKASVYVKRKPMLPYHYIS